MPISVLESDELWSSFVELAERVQSVHLAAAQEIAQAVKSSAAVRFTKSLAVLLTVPQCTHVGIPADIDLRTDALPAVTSSLRAIGFSPGSYNYLDDQLHPLPGNWPPDVSPPLRRLWRLPPIGEADTKLAYEVGHPLWPQRQHLTLVVSCDAGSEDQVPIRKDGGLPVPSAPDLWNDVLSDVAKDIKSDGRLKARSIIYLRLLRTSPQLRDVRMPRTTSDLLRNLAGVKFANEVMDVVFTQ